MRITEVDIKHFRAIHEEKLKCDDLTVIVGPNGSGKSTFLKALEYFYDPASQCSENDFYARDISQKVEISVTFCNLSQEEKEKYKSYLDNDESLTVIKTFEGAGEKGKYYGQRKQYSRFQDIRHYTGREFIEKYAELRKELHELPSANSQAKCETALSEWEAAHPDQLRKLRDGGQFFGFSNVGAGRLSIYTSFILIPGVQEAKDFTQESRNSPITRLMDFIVRNNSDSTELEEFKDRFKKEFESITDPEKTPELGKLANTLSSTLNRYYRDTSVNIDWDRSGEIALPTLQADLKIDEKGYKLPVESTGHGLQRALIMTLLQHLAVITSEAKQQEKEKLTMTISPPHLILAIEEPELYQHPTQQRKFSRILLNLAQEKIEGEASKIQVIYSTHSPLMLGIDRVDNIRRMYKEKKTPDKPAIAKIQSTTWENIAYKLWEAGGSQKSQRFTKDTLQSRMQALMTPWMNEGFFANKVVLVEGESDRAAIISAGALQDIDFDSLGIAIIPCNGKESLDRPALIFKGLNIPTYLIWDCDKKNKGGTQDPTITNRRLLRISGANGQNEFLQATENLYSCHEHDLETTLKNELGGDFYENKLQEIGRKFEMSSNDASKKPMAITTLLQEAKTKGKTSKTLDAIVDRIVNLSNEKPVDKEEK